MKLSGAGKTKNEDSKVYGPGRRKKRQIQDDDTIVTGRAGAAEPFEKSEAEDDVELVMVEVKPIRAFEGGLVHAALKDVVNTYWQRSDEITILYGLMSQTLTIDGVYAGDIVTRPSFVTKSGGMAML